MWQELIATWAYRKISPNLSGKFSICALTLNPCYCAFQRAGFGSPAFKYIPSGKTDAIRGVTNGIAQSKEMAGHLDSICDFTKTLTKGASYGKYCLQ